MGTLSQTLCGTWAPRQSHSASKWNPTTASQLHRVKEFPRISWSAPQHLSNGIARSRPSCLWNFYEFQGNLPGPEFPVLLGWLLSVQGLFLVVVSGLPPFRCISYHSLALLLSRFPNFGDIFYLPLSLPLFALSCGLWALHPVILLQQGLGGARACCAGSAHRVWTGRPAASHYEASGKETNSKEYFASGIRRSNSHDS